MRILFVCLGNICRSPLAEGITRKKLEEKGLSSKIEVDSVGFEPFHQGDHPDSRAIEVAKKHGVDISRHVARLFSTKDFDQYDKIYVMDHNNYRNVSSKARNENDLKKTDYFLNVLNPGSNQVVPDPWYGGMKDFEHVYDLLEKAADVVTTQLKNELT